MNRLLISGIDGRMGREVARLCPDYGFAPRPFVPEAQGAVIVDFSHPDCLDGLLESPLPLVIGTTGYTAEQAARIREAARARPVFQAANFSPGVYALGAAVRAARRMLPDWDVSLIERHHIRKQDSPSGTALDLARRIGLKKEQILSVRGGTVRGVHELTFYGPEETLLLIHAAESRAVFAHGALRAARWLIGQSPGMYGMKELLSKQEAEGRR